MACQFATATMRGASGNLQKDALPNEQHSTLHVDMNKRKVGNVLNCAIELPCVLRLHKVNTKWVGSLNKILPDYAYLKTI